MISLDLYLFFLYKNTMKIYMTISQQIPLKQFSSCCFYCIIMKYSCVYLSAMALDIVWGIYIYVLCSTL